MKRWWLRPDQQPEDRCPPHRFVSTFSGLDENTARGVIFCKSCGDIRGLVEPTGEAPESEKLTPAEMEQLRRDYGEPT